MGCFLCSACSNDRGKGTTSLLTRDARKLGTNLDGEVDGFSSTQPGEKKKKKKKKQHAQGYETDPRRPSGSFFSCLIAFERFAHAALVWFEPFASPSQILESLSLVRSFVSDSAALFFAQVPFKRFAVFLRSSSPFGRLAVFLGPFRTVRSLAEILFGPFDRPAPFSVFSDSPIAFEGRAPCCQSLKSFFPSFVLRFSSPF